MDDVDTVATLTGKKEGDSRMKASSFSFQAAVLFVIAGMIWGIQMAISQDHSAFPAHAHLNLLGWVSLFLFGIYYRLHPALDRSRAALAHVSIWSIGTIILAVGVGLVHTGHEAGDPIAAIGALLVLADMLMFGWLVVKCERAPAQQDRQAMQPAE
jgi:peptidoglycan/LPS O-acetylase OafA/YrhL